MDDSLGTISLCYTVSFHRRSKHSAERFWTAITDPGEVSSWMGGPARVDLRPGGAYRAVACEEMQAMGMPELLLDGEVIEADPPRKLVHTWHPLWDESVTAEAPTRVTYEIDEDDEGYTRLTVTHELEGAPFTAESVAVGPARLHEGGGGWPWILSSLKTLLETGKL